MFCPELGKHYIMAVVLWAGLLIRFGGRGSKQYNFL